MAKWHRSFFHTFWLTYAIKEMKVEPALTQMEIKHTGWVLFSFLVYREIPTPLWAQILPWLISKLHKASPCRWRTLSIYSCKTHYFHREGKEHLARWTRKKTRRSPGLSVEIHRWYPWVFHLVKKVYLELSIGEMIEDCHLSGMLWFRPKMVLKTSCVWKVLGLWVLQLTCL